MELFKLREHVMTDGTVHTSSSFMFSDWGMVLSHLASEDEAALLFLTTPTLSMWWSPTTNSVYSVSQERI